MKTKHLTRLVMRKMRGVTLVELMIVIAVIALLAAIAIPSYRRYLIRSQRSEAKIALMRVQTAQEKFYLQFNTYTSNVTNAMNGSPAGLGLSNQSETGKYTIAITTIGGDGQSYTATAAPRTGGGQTDDSQCMNFTITERGTRGVSGPQGSEYCWK
ncbi:MAG TPA: type IV pilin protein [Steroidobacteraceae bacterium]|nr:type IV pilin protein [Steroidobacteraceae bacterium]